MGYLQNESEIEKKVGCFKVPVGFSGLSTFCTNHVSIINAYNQVTFYHISNVENQFSKVVENLPTSLLPGTLAPMGWNGTLLRQTLKVQISGLLWKHSG